MVQNLGPCAEYSVRSAFWDACETQLKEGNVFKTAVGVGESLGNKRVVRVFLLNHEAGIAVCVEAGEEKL